MTLNPTAGPWWSQGIEERVHATEIGGTNQYSQERKRKEEENQTTS